MAYVDDNGAGTSERQGVAAIRDRLRNAIVTGELGPDTISTQTQLADAFGVSRTPMREALRMLELEGLIVRETEPPLPHRRVLARRPRGPLRHPDLAGDERAAHHDALVLARRPRGARRPVRADGALRARAADWQGFECLTAPSTPGSSRGRASGSGSRSRRLWDHATRYRTAYATRGRRRGSRRPLGAAPGRAPRPARRRGGRSSRHRGRRPRVALRAHRDRHRGQGGNQDQRDGTRAHDPRGAHRRPRASARRALLAI